MKMIFKRHVSFIETWTLHVSDGRPNPSASLLTTKARRWLRGQEMRPPNNIEGKAYPPSGLHIEYKRTSSYPTGLINDPFIEETELIENLEPGQFFYDDGSCLLIKADTLIKDGAVMYQALRYGKDGIPRLIALQKGREVSLRRNDD